MLLFRCSWLKYRFIKLDLVRVGKCCFYAHNGILKHLFWHLNTSDYIFLFIDIDECAAQVNPCDAVANSECMNTNGSYSCQCKDGFVKNGPNCEGATQFFFSMDIFNAVSISYS